MYCLIQLSKGYRALNKGLTLIGYRGVDSQHIFIQPDCVLILSHIAQDHSDIIIDYADPVGFTKSQEHFASTISLLQCLFHMPRPRTGQYPTDTRTRPVSFI